MKPKTYRVVRKPRSGNIYFINTDPTSTDDFLMYDGQPHKVDIDRIYAETELIITGSTATINELDIRQLNTHSFKRMAGF